MSGRPARAWLIALAALVLAGCGQMGALSLPEAESSAGPGSAAAETSATGADADADDER